MAYPIINKQQIIQHLDVVGHVMEGGPKLNFSSNLVLWNVEKKLISNLSMLPFQFHIQLCIIVLYVCVYVLLELKQIAMVVLKISLNLIFEWWLMCMWTSLHAWSFLVSLRALPHM